MPHYRVRVGTKYLGAAPLYSLTSEMGGSLRFVSEARAERGVAAALEKFPAQSLDGYVIDLIEGS